MVDTPPSFSSLFGHVKFVDCILKFYPIWHDRVQELLEALISNTDDLQPVVREGAELPHLLILVHPCSRRRSVVHYEGPVEVCGLLEVRDLVEEVGDGACAGSVVERRVPGQLLSSSSTCRNRLLESCGEEEDRLEVVEGEALGWKLFQQLLPTGVVFRVVRV